MKEVTQTTSKMRQPLWLRLWDHMGGGADQTHNSHNNAPAVATGIGCGWQAQAALGSKMALKTHQRRIEVSLNGASLRAPSHPQSIYPVSIPSWHLMPHEVWCWLLWSGPVKSPEVHCSNCFTCVCFTHVMDTSPSITVQALVFKWRGLQLACGTVR